MVFNYSAVHSEDSEPMLDTLCLVGKSLDCKDYRSGWSFSPVGDKPAWLANCLYIVVFAAFVSKVFQAVL